MEAKGIRMARKNKKKDMESSTPALRELEKAGATFEPVHYEHSADHMDDGYGMETARKLGIDPHRVFKTLLADSGDEIVVGVVPVSGHLDMKKLARAAGLKKCDMADPKKAMRVTGYVVGGISPFGQKVKHRIFLDSSAMDFDSILVSGGKRGFSVALAPQTLLDVTGGTAADIAQW